MDDVATDLFDRVRPIRRGDAAHTVLGDPGHPLRQTAITLLDGQEPSAHESWKEATLHALRGRFPRASPSGSIETCAGELITIPQELLTRDRGEEMERIVSSDPAFVEFVGASSDNETWPRVTGPTRPMDTIDIRFSGPLEARTPSSSPVP